MAKTVADGTMFVGCYRPDRVWRIPPGGEPEVMLDDPDGVAMNQPANVAFFGTALTARDLELGWMAEPRARRGGR